MTTRCIITQKNCVLLSYYMQFFWVISAVLLGYYAGVWVRIKNYDYSLHNNPEELHSPGLLRAVLVYYVQFSWVIMQEYG